MCLAAEASVDNGLQREPTDIRGLVTEKRKKKVLDMLLSYCPNAIYGDLDGTGGEYLEKMRKTDIHDILHSPYYTGNNTQ